MTSSLPPRGRSSRFAKQFSIVATGPLTAFGAISGALSFRDILLRMHDVVGRVPSYFELLLIDPIVRTLATIGIGVPNWIIAPILALVFLSILFAVAIQLTIDDEYSDEEHVEIIGKIRDERARQKHNPDTQFLPSYKRIIASAEQFGNVIRESIRDQIAGGIFGLRKAAQLVWSVFGLTVVFPLLYFMALLTGPLAILLIAPIRVIQNSYKFFAAIFEYTFSGEGVNHVGQRLAHRLLKYVFFSFVTAICAIILFEQFK